MVRKLTEGNIRGQIKGSIKPKDNHTKPTGPPPSPQPMRFLGDVVTDGTAEADRLIEHEHRREGTLTDGRWGCCAA